MIWNTFKFIISAISLFVATLIVVFEPLNFGTIGIASLFAFLASALWIDFTKSQDSQNITPVKRNLAKTAIWVLVIIFTMMFVGSFFTNDIHGNSRGFVQLITALLKAL